EQDVHLLDEPAVGLGGGFGPAARLPQRRAVVEVERDDRAVAPGDGHRLEREPGGAGAERGEDAAAVEPPCSFEAEDRLPVDVPRPHGRRSGVRTVRAAEGGPDAEAALDEVEAVADASPDPVVRQPADVRLVDAALQDQILEEAADRI